MEKRFYKIIEGGILQSIWAFEMGVVIRYDMIEFTKRIYTQGVPCDLLCKVTETPIEQTEFEYFKSLWATLGKLKWDALETLEVCYEEVKPEINGITVNAIALDEIGKLAKILAKTATLIKEAKRPKTKYQLYNEDNSIEIYGYSTKSMADLVSFFETEGRKRGFRVLDQTGLTRGFVHCNLFNTLSYHITKL